MKYLKAKNILLAIVFISMVNNITHLVNVYTSLTSNENEIAAIFVVLAFDLFVIALIAYRKDKEALLIAIAIFAINCIYYDVLTTSSKLLAQYNSEEMNKLAASLIFSGLFSFAIHRAAVLISEEKQESQESRENTYELQQEIKDLKAYKSGIEESLTCSCGYKAENHKQLAGHQSRCEHHKAHKNNVISLAN